MKKNFPILFVDDEEYNLVAFKATFREDYDIYTAQSGKEALEIIEGKEIGLIITDQRMPEMTGVELLEKVLPKYPDSVRIILTGYSDVEAIVSAINDGNVFRYITKPWDERELMMTIENAHRLYELTCTVRCRPLGMRNSTGSWSSPSGTMMIRRLFL